MSLRGPTTGAAGWRRILAFFWLTSLVEGMGVSQMLALLPTLLRTMGVPDGERLPFVGLFWSLMFVLGMPLVPLWGVWADKVSRKAVIVRSSVVAAVVFAVAALAREPWQVAVSLLLIGLQLGNTGVMLAAIRDVTPHGRLGTAIALFGVSAPLGFAAGPILAGALIDGLDWSIAGVLWLSSALSVASAVLIAFGTHEIRPTVVPEGGVLELASEAVRRALGDPLVRRLFAVYGVVFLANHVSRPYTPLLVEGLVGSGPGLATAIGLVLGVASLVGALGSSVTGWIGDRAGFRPVLIIALAAGGVASLAMPVAANVPLLAGFALVFGGAVATVGAMVFALLATEVSPERRSATLNLVYLPVYVAGIVGPSIGAAVSSVAGAGAPFVVGGAVFLVAAVAVAMRRSMAPSEPLLPSDVGLADDTLRT